MKKWMVFVVVILLHDCLQLQVGLLHAAPEEHTLTFHIRISASAPAGGLENSSKTNHTMVVVNRTLSGGGHGGFGGGGFWSGGFSSGGRARCGCFRGFASAGCRKGGNGTDADGQHSGSNSLFGSVNLIVTLITIVGILSII